MEFKNDNNLLTVPEFIQFCVDDFIQSKTYRMMLDGERYYQVDNTEIEERVMTYIGDDDRPIEDASQPNNKYMHGFMTLLVDDKINYLLTKPYTMNCEDETYLSSVRELLGMNFQTRMVRIGTDASNKGVSWIHPIIDDKGAFKLVLVDGDQGVPLWADNEHTELDAFIWFYRVEVFEGKQRKWITKAEYWTQEGVAYYVREGENSGTFILDSERYLDIEFGEDEFVEHFRTGDSPQGWGRVPFVAFKNNEYEFPDIKRVKSLIDGYDLSRSDLANVLEDMKSAIFGLKGYGGQDLGEFMRDLRHYRAIKLEEDGGMDTYIPTINIEAIKENCDTLRNDIYCFGGGVNKDSDKFGNNPSGIALKFIYSGLDLKCNKLESCFKLGFENLLYFVNKYLQITGKSVSDKPVEVIFNRDIAINESQTITDCRNSAGLISNETIIANHPWVENVDEELKRMTAESDDYALSNGGDADENKQ